MKISKCLQFHEFHSQSNFRYSSPDIYSYWLLLASKHLQIYTLYKTNINDSLATLPITTIK